MTNLTGDLKFTNSMTCDELCYWLKQNKITDKDIKAFKGTQGHCSSFIYNILHINSYYACTLSLELFSAMAIETYYIIAYIYN